MAVTMLKAYGWPGNVRQLENTVFRAIVLCEGDELGVDDFPQIASLVEGYEAKIPPGACPSSPAAPSAGARGGDRRRPAALSRAKS